MGLLDRDREFGVPGDVDLVAHLDLIEHDRIDDPPAVFPAVDPSKEIDDVPLSMATIVAVIFRTITCEPLDCVHGVARVDGIDVRLAWRLQLATTLLLYVALTCDRPP